MKLLFNNIKLFNYNLSKRQLNSITTSITYNFISTFNNKFAFNNSIKYNFLKSINISKYDLNKKYFCSDSKLSENRLRSNRKNKINDVNKIKIRRAKRIKRRNILVYKPKKIKEVININNESHNVYNFTESQFLKQVKNQRAIYFYGKKTKQDFYVGENVKVISGEFKGKEGIVKRILRSKNQVIIEGINLKEKLIEPNIIAKKHEYLDDKPIKKIYFSNPIDIKHVRLISPHCGKPIIPKFVKRDEYYKDIKDIKDNINELKTINNIKDRKLSYNTNNANDSFKVSFNSELSKKNKTKAISIRLKYLNNLKLISLINKIPKENNLEHFYIRLCPKTSKPINIPLKKFTPVAQRKITYNLPNKKNDTDGLSLRIITFKGHDYAQVARDFLDKIKEKENNEAKFILKDKFVTSI